MWLWLLMGLLTATALLAVIAPLLRPISGNLLDVKVFGNIKSTQSYPQRATAIVTALSVALLSVGLYLAYGAPDLPDRPLSGRTNERGKEAMFRAMVDELAARMRVNPKDAEGWQLLAAAYGNLGRYAEAADAYESAARLLGNAAPAELLSAQGEALVFAENGAVTPRAYGAFLGAVAKDPNEPRARFYLARAKSQSGDVNGAIADLETLLKELPADAGARPYIEEEAATLRESLVGDPPLQ